MDVFRRPIPVTFLITGLGRGGAETQLLRLVLQLDREQWSPRVIAMLQPRAVVAELNAAGIPLSSLNMKRGMATVGDLFRCIRLLQRDRPEIMVCFMFHAILLGRIAGWIAGVPTIISSVRTGVSGGAWKDGLLRLTDWLGTVTTTNSRSGAERLVARSAVPRNRIRVIPNALPDDLPAPSTSHRIQLRKALGIHSSEFLWLAVGRFEAAKDYPNLIHAFADVARQRPEGRLWIAGEGPLQEVIHRMVTELKLLEVVRFLGLRTDVPELLTAADAYVLSSAWEGLPNSLMEALALGIPAVATSVGGVPELIKHGETGLLAAPGQAISLAQAMLNLMTMTPVERVAMGSAAASYVREEFSSKKVMCMWNELLVEHLRSKFS